MFLETKQFHGHPEQVDVTFPRPSMDGTQGSGESVRLQGEACKERGGVRLVGRLTCRVPIHCSRCDAAFPFAVEAEIDLLYTTTPQLPVPDSAEAEIWLSNEDCVYAHLDERERIDLLTLAREQIYLSLPLKPVCKADCLGLCNPCGIDLNSETCDCTGEEADPRWAALADWQARP